MMNFAFVNLDSRPHILPQKKSARQINCARVDLTTIETITIDNETTVDMDDALSLAETESTYEVYIHISDVDALIPKDSEHDKEAFKRHKLIFSY